MVTPKMAQIFAAVSGAGRYRWNRLSRRRFYHDAGATTPQGMRRAGSGSVDLPRRGRGFRWRRDTIVSCGGLGARDSFYGCGSDGVDAFGSIEFGDVLSRCFLMDQRWLRPADFRFSLHSIAGTFAEGDFFGFRFVAEVDGDDGGGFAIAEVEGGDGFTWLRLDVDPERRRLGIARRMLGWIEERGGVEFFGSSMYFVENLEAVRFL